MSASGRQSPVATLTTLYGAGGSAAGRRVAERLGVPFLDRAIPEAVASGARLRNPAPAPLPQEQACPPATLQPGNANPSTACGGSR
jgi:hypothetical protein